MKVTVLFEKEGIRQGLECGWGISYLIGDVLFDTAEKPEFLLNNIKEMGVDVERIHHVAISHNNWDHRAGLWEIVRLNPKIKIHVCSDFYQEFKDKLASFHCNIIEGYTQISDDIYSSGCVKARYRNEGLLEQVVIVKTHHGLSIACGCAHPGILRIIETVSQQHSGIPLYCVFGGFHLMETDARVVNLIATEMKRLGVKKVAPGHCCGYEAVSIFKEVYKEDCLDIKVGMEFEI